MSTTIVQSRKMLFFKNFNNFQLEKKCGELWSQVSVDLSVCIENSKSECANVSDCDRHGSRRDSIISEPPCLAAANSPSNLANFLSKEPSQLDVCSLKMDMTFEDRLFFSLLDRGQLKHSLQGNCYIDFASQDNKVNLVGTVQIVRKICNAFKNTLKLSVKFEFQFFNESYLKRLSQNFELLQQSYVKCFEVLVTMDFRKLNAVLFAFYGTRSRANKLIKAIKYFHKQIETTGQLASSYTSCMMIPANRRDLTGRKNMHIEQIEKQTETKIELIRFAACPQFSFEQLVITGQDISKVLQARLELCNKFSYELKLQVCVQETKPLLDCIQELSSRLNSISITIEPASTDHSCRDIFITGRENNIDEMFDIREKLLEQVQNCNRSQMW